MVEAVIPTILLASVASVARDVVFSFAEEAGRVVGEVDGHQKVFGAVSPAFETLFEEHRVASGEGDVLSIVMKASALKAFVAMTAHIYRRQTAAAGRHGARPPRFQVSLILGK